MNDFFIYPESHQQKVEIRSSRTLEQASKPKAWWTTLALCNKGRVLTCLTPDCERWTQRETAVDRLHYILVIWYPGSKICNRRMITAVWVWFRLFIDSNERCNTVNIP